MGRWFAGLRVCGVARLERKAAGGERWRIAFLEILCNQRTRGKAARFPQEDRGIGVLFAFGGKRKRIMCVLNGLLGLAQAGCCSAAKRVHTEFARKETASKRRTGQLNAES
jgi:hypothetical protein